MRDLLNNIKADQVKNPIVVTADANCSSVDMRGYGSVAFYALIGASGDTLSGSVYIELEVEESADNSTFTDAPDAVVRGAVTGTNPGTFAKINDPAEDDTVYKAQYIGSKRYVRPVINVTGTHTVGTPIGILAVRDKAAILPVV